METQRHWVAGAIAQLEAERRAEIPTPLIKLNVPEFPSIAFYLKDESKTPSATLKHRIARTLFLRALGAGHISRGTPIVDASSGSMMISEAHFAGMLGLPLTAVVRRDTAPGTLAAIAGAGARLHFCEPDANAHLVAACVAESCGGHYINHFGNTRFAADWLDEDNIAPMLVSQVSQQERAVPAWIVVGAETGCTSATLGFHIRSRPELARTRVCVSWIQLALHCFHSTVRESVASLDAWEESWRILGERKLHQPSSARSSTR